MVRAVVMPKPMDPLEVREYADPELRPGEVLLETLCSEICGTDIHLHHGKLAGVPYPLIPGLNYNNKSFPGFSMNRLYVKYFIKSI